MAETLKPGDGKPGNTSALKRWITDITRQKSEAKEWNGKAAQATGQAVEETGLDKAAITLTASLHRKEPAKRTTIVTDILTAFREMGWIEEGTLFGTPGEQAATAPAPAAAKEAPKGRGRKGTGATGADIQEALNKEAAAAAPAAPSPANDEWNDAAPPPPPPAASAPAPIAPAPTTVQ